MALVYVFFLLEYETLSLIICLRVDNVRYATSYCLFGIPSNDDLINTPCLTSYVLPRPRRRNTANTPSEQPAGRSVKQLYTITFRPRSRATITATSGP